jgi:hypothetical protein
MSRPAERVVVFYNKRGTCEQWIKGCDQLDAAVVPDVRGQCRAAPASYARLQPWQLSPHAGDTRADQGLVADEPEGEADQNRSEGRQPRPLCRIPNGRGRHPATNVPGDFAADRRTTAAAACANMRCRWLCAQEQPIGGVRPNARENGQISPAGAVRAVRDDGTRPRRHPLLRERGKIAKMHARSGVIRGIPA